MNRQIHLAAHLGLEELERLDLEPEPTEPPLTAAPEQLHLYSTSSTMLF